LFECKGEIQNSGTPTGTAMMNTNTVTLGEAKRANTKKSPHC